MPDKASMIETVFQRNLFDPAWYRDTYPDVDILGMEPGYHYRTYGHLMGRAPDPEFSAAALLQPPPPVGRELQQAHEIAQEGDYAKAISFARLHLPKERAHTIHTLRANAAMAQGDDAGWLTQLNGYLAHFNVAPVGLQGGGMLIERLSCAELPAVEGGPLISILMPAWNAEKSVAAAARSILAQTWRNLELIIVDDASEDGTWLVLQKLAQQDKRVRILRNTANVGPYVSKNIALMGAQGEFVTGHDADDWAHPQRLAEQVEFLMQSDRPSCLSGMIRMEFSGLLNRINPPGINTQDGVTRSAFISLMMRRRFLRHHLGAWDEVRFGGDSELIRRQERVTGHETSRLINPTMFCFDNPEGLTNHPEHGHNEKSGVSESRRDYASAFKKWHITLTPNNCQLAFPQDERSFAAPEAALNSPDVIKRVVSEHERLFWPVNGFEISADVIFVTNVCFPGGNTSSTLDEVNYFISRGVSVWVVHVPTGLDFGRKLSTRYDNIKHLIFDFKDISAIHSKLLILRNPSVARSSAMSELAPKIHTDHLVFVKNNSAWRPSGEPVYTVEELLPVLRKINANNRTIVPISLVMRREACDLGFETLPDIRLSPVDWTPTFDIALYQSEPKARMAAPYRIGRHGRDGLEKWLSDADKLRKIYPATDDFRIRILGGAGRATDILGSLPENWEVLPFGSTEPYDYLKQLDAFVYFPDENLAEAFGRTVVEAMIAGVPCILPHRFADIFGDLAFYSHPEGVENLIRQLANRDEGRVKFLKEVQKIAVSRYASSGIGSRFVDILPELAGSQAFGQKELSALALKFREAVMSGFVVQNI